MKRTVSLLAATALVSACATGPFPADVRVGGRYAKRLSQSDIQQITAALGSKPRSTIRHITIEAVGAAEVQVEYVDQPVLFGIPTQLEHRVWLTVTKHQGKWTQPTPHETVTLD